MTITVITADGDPRFRDGLRAILDQQHDIRLVAETYSAQSLLTTAGILQPDVAIVDLYLPDGDGFATACKLLKDVPTINVIALSMHNDQRYVSHCRQCGIAGFLLKDCAYEELTRAVRTVAAKRPYTSSTLQPIITDGGPIHLDPS